MKKLLCLCLRLNYLKFSLDLINYLYKFEKFLHKIYIRDTLALVILTGGL